MQSAMPSAAAAEPIRAPLPLGGRRMLMVALTAAALVAPAALASGNAASAVDPDLARLLRFMALLKGVFAVVALGACWWRLARPAAAWREIVYVAGPGLMAGGATCLWFLQAAGLATLGLHVGMFALLGAALTDEAFIPTRLQRAR